MRVDCNCEEQGCYALTSLESSFEFLPTAMPLHMFRYVVDVTPGQSAVQLMAVDKN